MCTTRNRPRAQLHATPLRPTAPPPCAAPRATSLLRPCPALVLPPRLRAPRAVKPLPRGARRRRTAQPKAKQRRARARAALVRAALVLLPATADRQRRKRWRGRDLVSRPGLARGEPAPVGRRRPRCAPAPFLPRLSHVPSRLSLAGDARVSVAAARALPAPGGALPGVRRAPQMQAILVRSSARYWSEAACGRSGRPLGVRRGAGRDARCGPGSACR